MSKRKAYRPKQVNPSAHIVALQGSFFLSKPDQLKQAMNLATAVSNISKTGGLKEDWMIVFDVINVCNVTNTEGRLMNGGDDFIDGCMDMVSEAMERPGVMGCHSLFDQGVIVTKLNKETLTDFWVKSAQKRAKAAGFVFPEGVCDE